MKTYTISEKIEMRNMSKKDVKKIIDFYIRKFIEKYSIDITKKFYWESFYLYDEFFRGEFDNVVKFQKYLQKSYTKYLRHSETNCVIDFCNNFLNDNCYGEQI